jgi:hypothetical protein
MDERRLSTADVLASGILNKPAPRTGRPQNVEFASVYEDEWTRQSLEDGLQAGGVEGAFYYGCWAGWKTESGYSGELLQYRSVTDSFENVDLDEAVSKLGLWAVRCTG